MNNNINNNNSNQNNDNDKKEKKMAEVEKKSALPILSVGITWVLCLVLLRFRINATNLFLITVLSFIVYQIVKKASPPKKIEIMMEEEKIQPKPKSEEPSKKTPAVELTPEERALKDMNERIDLYFIEIRLLNDSIGDAFISAELLEIESSLKKIQVQLNEDTKIPKLKRIDQLSQFFDYYMPTTIKILNSYRRIESQNLTGENAMETKKRVEESLPLVKKAFDKELDYMFSEEMLDITTDIDVLEAMLSKDGLIDKHNINGIRDIKNDFSD